MLVALKRISPKVVAMTNTLLGGLLIVPKQEARHKVADENTRQRIGPT